MLCFQTLIGLSETIRMNCRHGFRLLRRGAPTIVDTSCCHAARSSLMATNFKGRIPVSVSTPTFWGLSHLPSVTQINLKRQFNSNRKSCSPNKAFDSHRVIFDGLVSLESASDSLKQLIFKFYIFSFKFNLGNEMQNKGLCNLHSIKSYIILTENCFKLNFLPERKTFTINTQCLTVNDSTPGLHSPTI